MLKKIIYSILLLSSFSIQASVFESEEYLNHKNKIFKYQFGDIIKDCDEITYLGENWCILDNYNEDYYYAQIDPLSKEITNIKIVSNFDEFVLGRELKYFSDLYGDLHEILNYYTFENNNLKVFVYTDFNVFDNKFDSLKSIIDLNSKKEKTKRDENLLKIYYEEKMIRR